MKDEDWQRYRMVYLAQHNIYLADTPEIRAQHDEDFAKTLQPGDTELIDVDAIERTLGVNLDTLSGHTVLVTEGPPAVLPDAKQKMLEAMRRRKNQG